MIFVVTHSQKIKLLQLLLVVNTVSILKLDTQYKILSKILTWFSIKYSFSLCLDLLSLKAYGKGELGDSMGTRCFSFCSLPPPFSLQIFLHTLSLSHSALDPGRQMTLSSKWSLPFFFTLRTICVHLNIFSCGDFLAIIGQDPWHCTQVLPLTHLCMFVIIT